MGVDLAVADFMAAGVLADFTVGVVAGSTAGVEVEAFGAEEEVSMEEGMGRPHRVTEPRMRRRRCDQAADTRRGRVMAIHDPAAALPAETNDTEVLLLLRQRLPMDDGIRFPVKVGVAARQARNHKRRPRRLQAECISLMAAAEPDLPGRLGVFQARATKSGKTPRALET